MATGRLLIYPTAPGGSPDPDRVRAALQQLGLIAASPDSAGRFRAGPNLLRHITFAGCSPHLEFAPPPDGSDAFCHITLLGPLPRARLLTGANTVPPRCPSCRQRLRDWRERLDAAAAAETRWPCPSCQKELTLATLDWRRQALITRFAVVVHEVFPGEAVPSDALLRTLATTSGVDWDYAWVRD